MGISTDSADWNDAAVDTFVPHKIEELLDKQMGHQDVSSFESEFPVLLLRMSGINFPPSARKTRYELIFGIVMVIAALYFGFHYFARS